METETISSPTARVPPRSRLAPSSWSRGPAPAPTATETSRCARQLRRDGVGRSRSRALGPCCLRSLPPRMRLLYCSAAGPTRRGEGPMGGPGSAEVEAVAWSHDGVAWLRLVSAGPVLGDSPLCQARPVLPAPGAPRGVRWNRVPLCPDRRYRRGVSRRPADPPAAEGLPHFFPCAGP